MGDTIKECFIFIFVNRCGRQIGLSFRLRKVLQWRPSASCRYGKRIEKLAAGVGVSFQTNPVRHVELDCQKRHLTRKLLSFFLVPVALLK